MRLRFMNDPPPPPVEWVADGLIQRGTLAVLAGAPSAAKSALMQNMVAADILGGGQWLGVQVRHAWPAMWLAYESAESTRRRLAALDPERHARVCIASGAPSLADDRAFDEIDRALDQAAERFGEPVKVLIVDALASSMRGHDENSGRDVGAALGTLLGLIDNRGLTSIVLSHVGKSGDTRTRGHSSVDADAASVLAVVGTGKDRRLRVIKQRDGEPVDDIRFDVVDRDGAPMTVKAASGGAVKPRQPRLSGDAAIMLNIIEGFGEPAVPFEAVRNSCRERFAFRSDGRSRGYGAVRQAISNARTILLDRGLIVEDGGFVSVSERQNLSAFHKPLTVANVSNSVSKPPSIEGGADKADTLTRPTKVRLLQ